MLVPDSLRTFCKSGLSQSDKYASETRNARGTRRPPGLPIRPRRPITRGIRLASTPPESEEIMTPIRLSRLLGAGALGAMLMLGCRHSHRHAQIICCDCCETVTPVPADPPKKPVTTGMLPPVEKEKDERPNILYRVVAPGFAPGSSDLVGTDEMTSADADKVHVRPGYTPGALYLQPRSESPVVQKPVVPAARPAAAAPTVDQPAASQTPTADPMPVEGPQEPELKTPGPQ
jgi:hypothetical protein